MSVEQLEIPVSDHVESTPESLAALDAAAEAEFAAGYSTSVEGGDILSTPDETPKESSPVVAEMAVAEPVVVEAAPEEYVQVKKSEWDQVLAQTAAVQELKQEMGKRFDTTFGKMGGLERTLTQLQQATPAGQPVVVTEEDLAELTADGFPDLTKSMAAGLTRVLSKLKGTGPSEPVDVVGQVQPLITQAIEAQRQEYAEALQRERLERLTDLHENWREIAGTKDSQTPYRQWLSTQPDGAKVLESDDPRVVGKSITAFLASQKRTPAASTTGRSQRLAEAVPARGGSGSSPIKTEPSDDDQFEAGFRKHARS